MTDAERNDAFNLRMAIDEAKRRVTKSGNPQMIFRAYNTYCIRPADGDFAGELIGVVNSFGDWQAKP